MSDERVAWIVEVKYKPDQDWLAYSTLGRCFYTEQAAKDFKAKLELAWAHPDGLAAPELRIQKYSPDGGEK